MFGIVLLVHCGFTRASVKTASVSKQNCLHIGLSWWGIKGIIVPVTGVVIVGTLRFGALRRLWEKLVAQGCSVSSRVDVWDAVSVCTPWAAAAGRVPLDKVGTPVTLDKGRNGSHSIICKVTCCLLSLFLLHSFYLYLNVLGNLRTNVKVKMQ